MPERKTPMQALVEARKAIDLAIETCMEWEWMVDPEHADPAPRMRAPEKIDVMPRVLNSKAWKDRP